MLFFIIEEDLKLNYRQGSCEVNEMGCLAELMIVRKDTLASLIIIVYDRNQVFWFMAEIETENGCKFRYDTKTNQNLSLIAQYFC